MSTVSECEALAENAQQYTISAPLRGLAAIDPILVILPIRKLPTIIGGGGAKMHRRRRVQMASNLERSVARRSDAVMLKVHNYSTIPAASWELATAESCRNPECFQVLLHLYKQY